MGALWETEGGGALQGQSGTLLEIGGTTGGLRPCSSLGRTKGDCGTLLKVKAPWKLCSSLRGVGGLLGKEYTGADGHCERLGSIVVVGGTVGS